MPYRQITQDERYQIAVYRRARLSAAAIARLLHRHRSTIGREVIRNRSVRDGYKWYHADCLARDRRSHSRRNQRLQPADWAVVRAHLEQRWTPRQIAGRFGPHWISHTSIYQYLRRDKVAGGELYRWLPQGRRHRRRHLGRRRRGGPLGRSIVTRPAHIDQRDQIGHWEIDTVVGPGRACLLTAVERATGYVVIGKLVANTAYAFARRAITLLRHQPHPVRTITADNGTEMTGYRRIESALGTTFYFSQPYSAWQRGSIENLNGLIRRHYPKRTDFTDISQRQCTNLARQLNRQPRERLGFHTPEECYVG